MAVTVSAEVSVADDAGTEMKVSTYPPALCRDCFKAALHTLSPPDVTFKSQSSVIVGLSAQPLDHALYPETFHTLTII